MHPVETYLQNLGAIHRTGGGTAEESYYGALETLLNEVGRKLSPAVRCVPQLKNLGAGEPDFGFYTPEQFRGAKDDRPVAGAPPSRGVVECKPWGDDLLARTATPQVAKYRERYGLVLVTNYREFLLVGQDESGQPSRREYLVMAESEDAFRDLLAHPLKTAAHQGDRLVEFLRRVMLHAAPLSIPEDLAWFLASYAREARFRVEAAAGLPALEGLKHGLEEALGLTFDGERGDHFFRATLVQTLFYGVFSSWVLWCRENPGGTRFNWHDAAWTLHVPMIASLFDQIATPTRLKPLGVDEVLDWAGAALNRVDQPAFFARFEEAHAVQYFYEPFLKAYDPELRKDLGVWYTPPEIVQYQVERVDRVLREELGLADGLADENVVVLDPCCGTGAYLVETLKRIHETLKEKGGSALTAQKLKKAAMERVFGFEILPAPFVVAHLQLGLMLRLLGAPLDHDARQRAGVFLTNALTGWDPPRKPKNELPLFPEMMEERDKANAIKRDNPILVILGNPPYNAFAGTSPQEEGGLVEPYKEGLATPVAKGGWGIKKFNLDDLYVRFFRIAERRIARTGKGVVSFISNFSYIDDPSFVAMRSHLIEDFDKIWIDCMNGDSRETGKLTPDGAPDPSVFSTEKTPVGIRVGTAVCLMLRASRRDEAKIIRYRDYWGKSKRRDLLRSLSSKIFDKKYDRANPSVANRYSFRPTTVSRAYAKWPSVTDLCEVPPSNGLMEKRGNGLISIDRDKLAARMRAYFSPDVEWETLVAKEHPLAQDAAGFPAKAVRARLIEREQFRESRIRRFAVRPFDHRWCYYSPVSPLWNRSRPTYVAQCWDGNAFFMARPSGVAAPEGAPFAFATTLGDNDFQRGHSYYFPILLLSSWAEPEGDEPHDELIVRERHDPPVTANLSKRAREYLAKLGLGDPDRDAETAGLVWMHALAMGYSPAYLAENADGIRQDWPRVPLPATRQALLESAALGRRVAALLDTEHPVEGVTAGRIDPALKSIGVIRKVGGGALNPDRGELDVTARWGHPGRQGVCMPGKGRLEAREQAGAPAFDVYLNDVAYWENIPEPAWNFHIGGYQVIKKWLSYREKAMLGRGIRMEEAEHVTEMARRLAALVRMQPGLDANYTAARDAASPDWQ